MNRSLAPHVFVSYSRDDEVFLQRLVADLQAHGITVWIDKSGIPPGTPDWENALRAAISTSQAIILIASPHSRSSRFVRDELSLAERYNHRIYPIWVDGTDWIDCIPMGYGRTQYIDARGSLYNSALNKLVMALNTLSVLPQLTEPLVTPEDFSWHCIRTLTGHESYVWSVAISADGQTLASGSFDKTIKLWNLKTGNLLRTLTGHKNHVVSVAISADGQMLASGSFDKTIKLWNLKTGDLLCTLTEHENTVVSVAISADGQTLASGSWDKTIKLWNLKTGDLLCTLTEHENTVVSVAISADGQTLASGSWDKTIK